MRDDDREALAAIIGKTWIADKDGCPLHLPDMVDAILTAGFRRDQSETIARLQKERDAAIARADKEDAEATWLRKTLIYSARQLDKTGLNCGSAPLEEMARRVVKHLLVLEKERDEAIARAEKAEAIINAALRECPVGNDRTHTADNLPDLVGDWTRAYVETDRELDAALAEVARLRQALSDISAERQNLQDRADDIQVAHWMCDTADQALAGETAQPDPTVHKGIPDAELRKMMDREKRRHWGLYQALASRPPDGATDAPKKEGEA